MGHYVYVPTGGEPRLPIPELDPASGVLTRKGEIELRAPGGAMCTDPDRRFLYEATREQSDMAVATFRIDPDGGLAPIGEVDLEGCHPCYLATDPRPLPAGRILQRRPGHRAPDRGRRRSVRVGAAGKGGTGR